MDKKWQSHSFKKKTQNTLRKYINNGTETTETF